MAEQWKHIDGFDGVYEVSDCGRVRSFNRQSRQGAILSQGWKGNLKYKVVVLSKNGVTTHFKIHRLVLETFVGPCPDGMEACHNNGINTDNRLSNLRWDSHAENIRDKKRLAERLCEGVAA